VSGWRCKATQNQSVQGENVFQEHLELECVDEMSGILSWSRGRRSMDAVDVRACVQGVCSMMFLDYFITSRGNGIQR
jgi:hypothetical protein